VLYETVPFVGMEMKLDVKVVDIVPIVEVDNFLEIKSSGVELERIPGVEPIPDEFAGVREFPLFSNEEMESIRDARLPPDVDIVRVVGPLDNARGVVRLFDVVELVVGLLDVVEVVDRSVEVVDIVAGLLDVVTIVAPLLEVLGIIAGTGMAQMLSGGRNFDHLNDVLPVDDARSVPVLTCSGSIMNVEVILRYF
jgi:hypothetical protein